jgi:hypothetical protein
MYQIQHCFTVAPQITLSESAGIEPKPKTGLLQHLHWQSDPLTTQLDLVRILAISTALALTVTY